MVWQPNHPAPSSYVSNLASVVRDNKVVIDDSMQTSFYWSDSVASGGVPRVSTTTPGSTRIFYGLESQVSYPGYDGALMYAHDSGKLWALNAGSGVPVSSTKAFHSVHQSQDAITASAIADFDKPQRNIIAIGLVNIGSANVKDTGTTVDFGTDFAHSPQIMLTTSSFGAAQSSASWLCCVTDVTTADFKLGVWDVFTTDPGSAQIYWRASGYTTLVDPIQVGIT